MCADTVVELQAPPLPYYLGAGRSHYQIGDQHPHRRSLGIYDLLIVAEGELHIGENGQQWTLSRGDTLLILPDGEHYPVKPCERETVFYWVHFDHPAEEGRAAASRAKAKGALYASRPFGNPRTLRLPKHTRLPDPEAAFALVRRMLTLPLDGSFWEEQRLLAELLVMLEQSNTRGAGTASDRLAEQTAAYIQAHYRDKLTNEAIAAALHFHPNYVVRCMKTKYGRTPIDYLLDYRLERSKRLLVTTEWPVERIAEEVGFRYAPYFSACFKRRAGVSPVQFRKRYFT